MFATDFNPENGNSDNIVGVNEIDYIEFYTGNAYQAAHFYRTMFGFKAVAYSGLETGAGDCSSFLITQGNVRFLLTSGLTYDSSISEHVKLHGDGVKDIAFRVDDASTAFDIAVKHGAIPVMGPLTLEDRHGKVVKSTIQTFGSTVHSFIQRRDYEGVFMPGYQLLSNSVPTIETGIAALDHAAVGQEPGQLDRWVEFYEKVFGFRLSHYELISTSDTAMNSKVVQNNTGKIIFSMVEPSSGKRKSQIEEYLKYYNGAGIQHLAFLSDNIIDSVQTLRKNNLEFLFTPDAYYDLLEERIGGAIEDMAKLRDLNILADCDESGYLLQIFTKPLQARPTFFIEIIQRIGARGFGSGNIRALFEAIEREQFARGNL